MDNGWETVPKTKKESHRPDRLRFASTDCPFMLLLVGLPGSGKTTFSKRLVSEVPGMFVRVSQDDIGDRKKCISLAHRTLKNNLCPVIDRCNFDEAQRRHFVELARECGGVPVYCIVLVENEKTCVYRCKSRTDHPTLDQHMAPRVIKDMRRKMRKPLINEGFAAIFDLKRRNEHEILLNNIRVDFERKLAPKATDNNIQKETSSSGPELDLVQRFKNLSTAK